MKLTFSLVIASLLAVSTLHALPNPVPDSGSSVGLIAVGLVALMVVRRKFFN